MRNDPQQRSYSPIRNINAHTVQIGIKNYTSGGLYSVIYITVLGPYK